MEIMGITDTRWRTATQLGVSDPRALKAKVQLHNMNYGKGDGPETNWYIMSCSHGYKLTKDFSEIQEDLERREHNARKMLDRIKKQKNMLRKMMNTAKMGGLF